LIKRILLLHKIPEASTIHTQNKKIDYNPIFITACFSSSRTKDSLGNHNFWRQVVSPRASLSWEGSQRNLRRPTHEPDRIQAFNRIRRSISAESSAEKCPPVVFRYVYKPRKIPTNESIYLPFPSLTFPHFSIMSGDSHSSRRAVPRSLAFPS